EVAAALRTLHRTEAADTVESAQEPTSVGVTAAVEEALAPVLAGGCGAVASEDPDLTATCAALGLDAGASLAGTQFLPSAAETAGTASYVVDLALSDGTLRSAEVDVAHRWDPASRQGAWHLVALRPR